jgi:hypothetical protein
MVLPLQMWLLRLVDGGASTGRRRCYRRLPAMAGRATSGGSAAANCGNRCYEQSSVLHEAMQQVHCGAPSRCATRAAMAHCQSCDGTTPVLQFCTTGAAMVHRQSFNGPPPVLQWCVVGASMACRRSCNGLQVVNISLARSVQLQ